MKLKWKSARLADRNQRSVGTRQIICNVEILERRRLLSNTAVQIFEANEEGASSTIGEYTTAGTTVNTALISGLEHAECVGVSGSDLFIPDPDAGTIAEYTTDGTLVNSTLISGLNNPMAIAVSGSELFVTNLNGTVGEYTTTGATVNASLITGLDYPSGIAVSGSNLFVVDYTTNGNRIGQIGEYNTSGAIVNASLVPNLEYPIGVAVSGQDLFVTQDNASNEGAGSIGEYTTSGNTVNAPLISNLDAPSGIAVYESDLFVVNIFAGSIGEYTTSGTTVNASLITGLDDPQTLCIATDQTVGPATQLAFGPPPTNITAGNVITPAISADVEDANGDIVIGDQSNVTISIASGPAGATLDGTTTVAALNGIATFSNLSLSEGGSYILTASDGSLSPASSTSISVMMPPPAGQIFIADQATDIIGEYTSTGATVNASLFSTGDPFGLAVSGADIFVVESGGGGGGAVAEYTTDGTIVNGRLISGLNYPNGIAISGSTIFVTSSNSANGAGLGTIGEYTTSGTVINASLVTGLGYPTGIAVNGSDIFVANETGVIGEYTTSGATVNASLISGLGYAQGVAISGPDLFVAHGSTIGEYTLSGTMIADPLVMGLNNAFGLAVSGSHLFVANYGGTTVGEYTTTGATVNAALISGLHSPLALSVAPETVGPAMQLAFGPQPASITAGSTMSPPINVDVEDANGNIVTTDTSNVLLSIASGPAGGQLLGTTTVAAQDGVANFSDLSLSEAGTYTLTASDGDYMPPVPVSFTVSSSVPRLVFVQQPQSVAAGGKMSSIVDLENVSGGLDKASRAKVRLMLIAGKLIGTVTAAAKNGVATFRNLSVQRVGTYTLTAAAPSFASAESTLVVMPAAIKKMTFSQQPPASVTPNAPFSAQIELFDRYGNLASNDNSMVAMSMDSHPKEAVLSGTPTISSSDGVADFDNLILDTPGKYTLKAMDGMLKTTSKQFVML